jgi:hypothetical protein
MHVNLSPTLIIGCFCGVSGTGEANFAPEHSRRSKLQKPRVCDLTPGNGDVKEASRRRVGARVHGHWEVNIPSVFNALTGAPQSLRESLRGSAVNAH